METVMNAPDFIMAGNVLNLNKWPVAAANVGILWCYKEHQSDSDCASCEHTHGCGISNGSLVQKILPISAVAHFDSGPYEQMLLLTPSKQSLKTDLESSRALVLKLLSALGDSDVHCFELCQTAAERKWLPLEREKTPGGHT